MAHNITVLGCSGGIGPDLRTTSLLVDDRILIDAGTGVGDLNLDQQQRIQQIFLTHAHLDHVCGLAFLADNLLDLVDAPLSVHARPEVIDALKTHLFNWTLWPDFAALPSADHPLLRWQPQRPGSSTVLSPTLAISSFTVHHTVPAVGYALTTPHSIFAFSGDTSDAPCLWGALNALPRLDLLMIEIAFRDEESALGVISRHFTPARLGQALTSLRHRPRLLLTHHKPGEELAIAAQCRTALAGWDYQHLVRGTVIDLP